MHVSKQAGTEAQRHTSTQPRGRRACKQQVGRQTFRQKDTNWTTPSNLHHENAAHATVDKQLATRNVCFNSLIHVDSLVRASAHPNELLRPRGAVNCACDGGAEPVHV